MNQKCSQDSRTFLHNLADIYIATFGMISRFPLTCISPNLSSRLLVIVLMVQTTIGINDAHMFHRFVRSLAKSRYSSVFYCVLFSLSGPHERQNLQGDL